MTFSQASKERFAANADYFRLVGSLPPLFAPGAEKRYCNGCYIALGAIVERASGMPYERYVEANVFRRADMGVTGYHRTDVHLNYQYRAFGVPGLGLKRGLADDLVIAPYATMMALMVAPREACERIPPLLTSIGMFYVHGAPARVAPDATAFGSRGAQWDFDIVSQWRDPAEAEQHGAWTRSFWREVEPYCTGGVYVNHIAGDEPERVNLAFGGNYERLVAVKNRYDPTNLFRLNHNIKPTV